MAVTFPYGGATVVDQHQGGSFKIRDMALTPGQVFYVCSNVTNASDAVGSGRDPIQPFATLDYAVSQCTADRVDTIFVLPTHTETTAVAGTELFDIDVDGVSVIGLGQGDSRPTFTLGEATASVVLAGANTRLSNIRLIGAVSDLAAGLEIEATADGCKVDHCYFADTASGTDMLITITIAADTDRIEISDNHFNLVTGGEATDCILMAGGCDGSIVSRNIAAGDWKTGGFLNASGAASLGLIVTDNIVVNQDASAGLCYLGHAGNTGLIANNTFAASKNGTEAISELTAMHVSQNYMTDVVGASGIISATVTVW